MEKTKNQSRLSTKNNFSPQRVLVIQPYGIGDALFMLPLLKALKTQKSVQRIDLILGSRTSQILENFPYVNDIFVIDKDKWRAQSSFKTLQDKWRLYLKIRKQHYESTSTTSHWNLRYCQ